MNKNQLIRLLALLLVLALLPAVPVAAEENVVIVIDPGHGGVQSGCELKYDGVLVSESVLCLKIANYCREYLLEHYENVEVLLTREEDEDIELSDRVNFAAEQGADYMLSIHLNADEGYARGALGLVPRGKYRPEQAKASIATAEAILQELEALGLQNRGTTYTLGTSRYPDGTYVDALAIIRGCVRKDIPVTLMEQCFMDNEDDYREFLSSEEKLRALGVANALGLARSLGLREHRRPSSADEGDTPFEDVLVGDWYYDDVTYVWEEGLMQGISDTQFGPFLTANRAMVVTLLYRMDGAELYPEESSFEDVPAGSWYHAPVEWALENGITTGVSETRFAPGRNVIREQFVTFLHRYAGEPEPSALPEELADWDTVSAYARNAMAWAVETGLLKGYEDGTIRPLRQLNRAELAVMMHRFHRWLLHERGELVYEWTQSEYGKELFVGDSFRLTLTNQFGETANPVWAADCEGVVAIEGDTVTAIGPGTALIWCEWDDQYFECLVEVTEKISQWTLSHTEAALNVGDSFELTLTNQYGESAQPEWTADCTGVVELDGTTVTAIGPGTALLRCEWEGQIFECQVEVTEKVHTWSISHKDVTIKVGESFYLRLKNEEGETASVSWSANKSGCVSISGNKITGKARDTVTVSCKFEGKTYSCIVRVKSA